MGNFSRDPELRLLDAESKHYIGLRIQQGVPVLDADLHLVEGLRRREVESIGQWVLGDGVPVGSDAFRVSALAGGGVNTIVLRSKTVGTGPSSIAVVLASSTAAAALGFDATNATGARAGNSPAQLTSHNAQPFVLAAGTTLTIVADGGAPETVTFVAGDFANIAAATAAEVAAKITATMVRSSAAAGTGGDFSLSGGNGTTQGAGRMLVEGRLVLIERGLRYSEQPLYQNPALAAVWGVPPVGALPTPAVAEVQSVFADVWHREVGRSEDSALVDSRIGIETAVSLRREWAVRAVPASQYAAALAARPAGHAYYRLAELSRGANDPKVMATMIRDLRDTDASVRPEIAYRTGAGAVVVDTARFQDMLTVTRDGARDFITYLTTKFVTPSSNYLAAEIAGIETLSAIANAADHALGAIFARTLGTRGALGVMRQLYDAEKRFVTTWQGVVLPLVKGGQAVYQTAFANSILTIKGYLDGPAPGGLIAITAALAASNLEGAVASQERIASELAGQLAKPLGTVSLKYLGSVSPTVLRNTPIDLRYEVTGNITPDDDLQVQVFIDPAWAVSFKNGDGSTPFALHGGPGAFTQQFFVSITPPDVPVAQTTFSVEVHAKKNPAGVAFVTTQKSLQINAPPPASEAQFVITVPISSVPALAGVYQVNKGTTADLTFRMFNNTGTAIAVDLEPSAAAAGWTVVKGPFALTNQPVPSVGSTDFLWHFTAPATAGPQLSFTLRARDHANPATIFADVLVTLESK
jgi:hypothetical protein